MVGDWPAALAAYRQSLTVARRMHDTDLLTDVVHGIAAAVGLQGDVEVIDAESGERLRVSLGPRERERYRSLITR